MKLKKSDQWLGKYYFMLGRIWVKWGNWFVAKTAEGFMVVGAVHTGENFAIFMLI